MSAGDGSLVGLSPQPVDSDTVAEWTVSGLSSVVERPAGIAENRLVGGGGGNLHTFRDQECQKWSVLSKSKGDPPDKHTLTQ